MSQKSVKSFDKLRLAFVVLRSIIRECKYVILNVNAAQHIVVPSQILFSMLPGNSVADFAVQRSKNGATTITGAYTA
jgi:hypothetical protein